MDLINLYLEKSPRNFWHSPKFESHYFISLMSILGDRYYILQMLIQSGQWPEESEPTTLVVLSILYTLECWAFTMSLWGRWSYPVSIVDWGSGRLCSLHTAKMEWLRGTLITPVSAGPSSVLAMQCETNFQTPLLPTHEPFMIKTLETVPPRAHSW